MEGSPQPDTRMEALDIPLERDGFQRSLVRQLTGTLQGVVGLEDARGVIEEAIALGRPGCHPGIYPRPAAESEAAEGREYPWG